jgi:hypothetical protein
LAALLTPPKTSSHPVDVGQRSEAAILAELVKRGYQVLLPFGTNQRYDLVIEQGGNFLRCQCKTGRLRKGVVMFSTQSIQCNTQATVIRRYEGQAELFLVYSPDLGKVFCVPVDGATDRMHVAPGRANA